ncbi:MAG: hypothetical protein N2578_03040 [Bdellovibrionaceae bacterium]|nr:hypothetical protein [Pseudobdellovibrionaceae bacterium]
MRSLVLFLIFSPLQVLAQRSNNSWLPMYFQADKNNLQVLDARFEYTLLDAERIKIGDILIDTRYFKFEIVQSRRKNVLRFLWPAGLLQSGRLTLLNNNGKSIWSSEIESKELKIKKIRDPENPFLRADIASFESPLLDPSILEEMKLLPFMNFCIHKEEKNTKIYLCSKELFLSQESDQIVVKDRSSSRKQARVEVNGKTVGPQGIVFLNDPKENIYFRAVAENGATLEIETRMRRVLFFDIVETKENKIKLSAKGAEPVAKSQVERLKDGGWSIELASDRPFLYIKGDGGIPFRREFLVRGPLPQIWMRPYLKANSPRTTYSSSLTLEGTHPAQVRIQAGDKDSIVEPAGKNMFRWTISDIPKGEEHRRFVALEAPNGKFYAAHEIIRGRPWFLSLGITGFNSSPAEASVRLERWFENLISRFRFGAEVSSFQPLGRSSSRGDFSGHSLGIHFRFSPGFNIVDDTWGAGLVLQNYQYIFGDISQNFINPGLTLWRRSQSDWLDFISDLTMLRLNYFASSAGDEFKLESVAELEFQANLAIKDALWWSYGLIFQSLNLKSDIDDRKNKFGFQTGLSWAF